MENENGNRSCPSLSVLQNVRCLECGEMYAKPCDGHPLKGNLGCPRCGYAGWISASVPLNGGRERPRFAADRLPHRTARSR